MRHPPQHIFQHTPDTLREFLASKGVRGGYRADQILEWVYQKGVVDPRQMTNLPASLRDMLATEMTFLSGVVLGHQVATDGTQKLLVQWDDHSDAAHGVSSSHSREGQGEDSFSLPQFGASPAPLTDRALDPASHYDASRAASIVNDPKRQTETVMIPSDDRKTACVSSQIGCPVGCRFCASGLSGLDGSLTAGRIVEQVWRLSRLRGVGRITNIVFMGMGEPLANFSQVTHAVRTLAAPWGLGISARKITVSTVGLHQAIERLAREMDLPITLALSLHAPNDELRRELIPWASFTSIDQLLGACSEWFKKTGREITLEYTLLGGKNDQPTHAHQLVRLIRRMREEAGGRANVNLIRYNEVRDLPFVRPQTAEVRRFQEILREAGVNAHIRASRGRDIAAACGQLRHETAKAG